MSISVLALVGGNNELSTEDNKLWNIKKYEEAVRDKINNSTTRYLLIDENIFLANPTRFQKYNIIVLSKNDLEKVYDVVCTNNLKSIVKTFFKENKTSLEVPKDLCTILSDYDDLYAIMGFAKEMHIFKVSETNGKSKHYFPYINEYEWKTMLSRSYEEDGIIYYEEKYKRRNRNYEYEPKIKRKTHRH